MRHEVTEAPVVVAAEVRQAVDDLVEPLVLLSMVDGGLRRADLPSRLELLRTSSQLGQGSSGRLGVVPGSRPPMRLECLDLLSTIRSGVVAVTGECSYPPARGVEAQLRVWADQAATDPEHRWLLLRKLRGWCAAADAVLGLADTVLTPHTYCMHCDRVGTTRVTLDESVAPVRASGGYCTACHSSWSSPEEVSVLTEWVRWSFEHLQGRAHLVPAGHYWVPVSLSKPRREFRAFFGSRAPVPPMREVCRVCRPERERRRSVVEAGSRSAA